MKAALLICFLLGVISLTGCVDQVDVSKAKGKTLLEQAQAAIHLEKESLKGSKWYAGRYAEKAGFNRTEKAVLKDVELREFTCKYSRDGAWYSLKRKTSCHSFVNFTFQSGKKEKVYQTIIKFNNVGRTIASEANLLGDRLAFAFVKKNPFSKRAFARYWKVLKKGKLAIGMPVDYLKICWGKPLRVFNKSIDSSGNRETFVYDRYFVFLENGIVRSIHKFDS